MAKYGGRHRRAYFSLSKEFLGKTLPDLLLTTSIPSSLPELNYISAFDTADLAARGRATVRAIIINAKDRTITVSDIDGSLESRNAPRPSLQ